MDSIEIISELGINHNGIYNTLIDLTDMAFGAGTDFVKLQLRTPELCVPKNERNKPKICPWDGKERTYMEYRKHMELSEEKLAAFDTYVTSIYGKRRWSASVWDKPSLSRLIKFDVPWIKVPSAMLTDVNLISACVETGIPLILSTGMSDRSEVLSALTLIPSDYPLTVMHCNSSYPARDDEANLSTMFTLGKMISGKTSAVVGFSNHHVSPMIPIGAMWMGAAIIEVHVTLDRSMIGSDHAASIEKPGLRLLVREKNRIIKARGNGLITLYDSELPSREKLRGN